MQASIARRGGVALAVFCAVACAASAAQAQDRLKTMPGYEQYARMAGQIATAVPGRGRFGGVATWSADSRSVDFANGAQMLRYDLSLKKIVPVPDTPQQQAGNGRGRGNFGAMPERGRQYASAIAPAGDHRAIYRDRNVWLGDSSGNNAVPVTTDGSEKSRVKYGTASWVYGEELSQRTAMWWAPNGKKLAFYRFDESKVPDFYLATGLTRVQDTLDVEAYPKPGVPNPIVDVFVYDVATKRTTRLDVRDGKPFENATVGYYVYDVAWSPDGREVHFLRTNRRQNTLEMAACNPESGACRVVLHEEWPTGWIDDDPAPGTTFLADGNRFIWESDRSGFKNYYLYDFKAGKLLNPITRVGAEVAGIVRIDEPSNTMFYLARDGSNYMKLQLHRVKLDGTNDVRLTDPAFNHTISLAPDGRHFVDVAETHDQAPVTRLIDANGTVVAELGTSDLSRFNALGLKKVEMYEYRTSDGQATLHGMIHFPSNFDPSRKYPVLVSVYGGPGVQNSTSERFTVPTPLAEYGFIVLYVEARTNPGMGRKYLDAVYLKLGQTEIDDMADGVKALWNRPYIDKNRVGIFGTSYGGYTSVMEILRHPEVFAAASASSPPTDWRNYDTIYTERYMWIPQENKEGYDKGSAMSYVNDLRGRLMLYYGSADNNVHPSNMMQLIQALQRAGKSFDVQVGPDQGHSGLNAQRMMEFFIENLVLNPAGPKA
ncbi:MAG TPA: DPP IV N-terminal domain-containing protein [Gemmatimonadaceae bacterium]|jgi:dipeptidyl-peptidase-4|nr:DPP IV N-terminal domain-containing protein [Gemmatimonadaceae bacterium]